MCSSWATFRSLSTSLSSPAAATRRVSLSILPTRTERSVIVIVKTGGVRSRTLAMGARSAVAKRRASGRRRSNSRSYLAAVLPRRRSRPRGATGCGRRTRGRGPRDRESRQTQGRFSAHRRDAARGRPDSRFLFKLRTAPTQLGEKRAADAKLRSTRLVASLQEPRNPLGGFVFDCPGCTLY